MVTEKEVERYKTLLNCVDFTTNLENKWHELIADLLIEIPMKTLLRPNCRCRT